MRAKTSFHGHRVGNVVAVLGKLESEGAMNISRLWQRLDYSQAFLSTILESMRKRGFVRRTIGAHRSGVHSVTSKGRALLRLLR